MLGGPGGNVLVVNGADGKVVIDSFVQPAFDNLKKALDGIGTTPTKTLIDTHWHVDHADNNENFRKAGAAVVAHENTRKRLTESHDLLGMHLPPAPAGALPTETFKDRKTINANGEKNRDRLRAAGPYGHGRVDPLHEGECAAPRRSLLQRHVSVHRRRHGREHQRDDCRRGCRAQACRCVDQIIPGHGPLGDRAALSKYRDMLVTVRDRVQS